MSEKTNKYKVKSAFRWRGHWLEANKKIVLLACEATSLISANKIELVTESNVVTSKKINIKAAEKE